MADRGRQPFFRDVRQLQYAYGTGAQACLSGGRRRGVREPTRTLTQGGTTPRGPRQPQATSLSGGTPPVPGLLDDDAILAPLEAQFGQVRSRDRVRDLAEVFTHQREVDAILDLIPDAFTALDVKFLEPSCGSGNFLTEVLRRKLRLVAKADCVSQEQYEQRLLRAIASIYGVDISPENVTEARGRMAHVLLKHYQADANTIEPTTGFLNAAALILGDNIVLGDTLNAADQIELCDWRPHPGGRFQRVWTLRVGAAGRPAPVLVRARPGRRAGALLRVHTATEAVPPAT